jgi:beta-glucosidase
MEPFKLPDDFLFGTATSSLQIEGGDRNNTWYMWADLGRIKDKSSPETACDHWNRTDEDAELMKKMNQQVYRMSLEWSRIEPKKGSFSQEAILHYRDEIKKLLSYGIRPLVTLHHFSNPLWFEDGQGWLNPESVSLFERYTEYAVRNLGDLVTEWITVNEPNVMLVNGYVTGLWPPGMKNIMGFLKASRHLICAHIRSYKKIHEIGLNMNSGETRVGVANHIRIFDPKTPKLKDRLTAGLYDHLFHDLLIRGMHEGKLLFPVGSGYPYGQGKYYDFFGINYYSRDIVSFGFGDKPMIGRIEVKEGAETSDLGWEIYPEGLYRAIKKYHAVYDTEIFITENGIDDRKDDRRIKFIYDHLFQVKKLIDEGVNVSRYYHWTLTDNFEWLEGYVPKFGLVALDLKKQTRKMKNSGLFYAGISGEKQVSKNTIDKLSGKKHVIEYFISEDD